MSANKAAFKKWRSDRTAVNRQAYVVARRNAKQTISGEVEKSCREADGQRLFSMAKQR